MFDELFNQVDVTFIMSNQISWYMKNASKMHFSEMHVNPINRDLFLVVTTAMLVSITFITAAVMIASQL